MTADITKQDLHDRLADATTPEHLRQLAAFCPSSAHATLLLAADKIEKLLREIERINALHKGLMKEADRRVDAAENAEYICLKCGIRQGGVRQTGEPPNF